MNNWIYLSIKHTLQIGLPFYRYAGYGVIQQHKVVNVENRKCAQTINFQLKPNSDF